TIFPDYERVIPVADPDNHELFISLGCALENLIIAAGHFGYHTHIEMKMDDPFKESIRVEFSSGNNQNYDQLFENIEIRQSTRSKYNKALIPPADIEKLNEAGNQDQVLFLLFTESVQIEPVIEITKKATVLQLSKKEFIKELMQWIRFNRKTAENTGDGLYSGAIGSPSVPKWLGKLFLNLSYDPKREARKNVNLMKNSSGILIFIAKENNKEAWVNLGRSFQRVGLTATSLNINHAHINSACEEISARKKLAEVLQLNPEEQPLLIIRIGYSEKRPYSFRRPLKEVLIN
ncbi:MAG: nitroreductase family protein, partial [Gillisia sp.]|nr:nitroreductase family protein [Gillisia sp.]